MSDTETDLGTASNLPVKINIPGYRLRAQCREDAIGLWFDAEQESLGRSVTLKILRPRYEAVTAARDQFLLEMDRLAPLDHERLNRVIDTMREDPLVLVTERIGGRMFENVLRAGRPLAEGVAISYAGQITSALQYLVGKGFAHKNVSPRLMALPDDDRCRLVTFRNVVTADELTALRGKLAQDARYIAPEQLAGREPIGPATHVYHIGCLLFHLLAGRPPHMNRNPQTLAKLHLTEPFPSLKRIQPFLTAGLHEFVAACAQKSPGDRPSLDEALEGLHLLLDGKDPEIRPSEGGAPDHAGGIVAPKSRRRRRRGR